MADESLGVVTPVVSTPAAPVTEVTPAPESPADQATEAPDGGEDQPSKPEKTYTESEHRKALQERLGVESRRLSKLARAEAERDLYRQQLEEARRPQQQAPQSSGEPQPKDFPDWDSYQSALVDYRVDQKLDQKLGKLREESAAEQQRRQETERARAVRENFKEAAEKYSDFHEVITADGLPFYEGSAMLAYITKSKAGGDIAYHLGNNRDEADRISSLHPIDQVIALKELESKLTAAPTPTRTPAPIVPNAGKGSVRKGTFELSVTNNTEWKDFVERRHKEMDRR